MFAGVVKVQHSLGLAKPILLHFPDPYAPIGHDKHLLGRCQSSPSSFLLHPPSKFLRLALPAHHVLLSNDSAATASLSGLFQPVNHRCFDLTPRHPLQARLR